MKRLTRWGGERQSNRGPFEAVKSSVRTGRKRPHLRRPLVYFYKVLI